MSRNPTTRKQRPFRSVASQMTVDDHLAVEEAAAAELRADWRTAFERHRSVPMYALSEHGADLRLLARLGDDAPDWLVCRYTVQMVRQWELFGQPQRAGRVLQTMVPILYPDHIPFDVIGCEHPQQVGSWIFGNDWVLRQADAYDLGGLEDLVNHRDAGPLVDRAQRLHEWLDAPMGGWRVVGADGDVMVLADAASGDEVRLLDLGLTTYVEPGEHVLGRIVPTDAAPGLLLDARPLPIDERTARVVATRPDQWLQVVAARTASGALEPGFSYLSPSSLTADLPRWSWGTLLGRDVDDLGGPPFTWAPQALATALGMASDADRLRCHRYAVSELLLDEAVDDRLLDRLATADRRAAWHALAAVVRPHAAARCGDALRLIEGMAG